MIHVECLTKRFGELAAVHEISFEVEQGEIFGFLGHNGAGKTTTVRLLNGVLSPSAGEIRVLGLDPMSQGPELRRCSGVLTETPCLDERLTARENLRIYADLYQVPLFDVDDRVDELLAFFELSDRADERVGAYSKGMKQRLALARTLLHRPELLCLDEPTAGLDPVAARQVHELITEVSHEEKRTVMMCTHNLGEAQALCDRVAVLEHGRLIALGTPGELARRLESGRSVELEVDSAQIDLAIETLQAQGDISEVSSNRNVLTISGLAHEQVPDVLNALVRAGIRVYRISPQEPSLEDVYFALHERTQREGSR